MTEIKKEATQEQLHYATILDKGDFLNFLPVAILSGVTIVILVLAVSGLLAVGH